jgi:death-on-curing protein
MTEETRYLDLEDALSVAQPLGVPDVRDAGLLDAALHRPASSASGQDAYVGPAAKAGALFESLVRNHPLVDGNERLAWTLTVVFLRLNGATLTRPADDVGFDVVVTAAAGEFTLDELTSTWASWIRRPHWVVTVRGETRAVTRSRYRTVGGPAWPRWPGGSRRRRPWW